jgi:DNA repair exonuclease SbcCD ATPase subunit
LCEQKADTEQRLAVMTKFETIAKRDFRGYLLQDIIVYINNRAKNYCKCIFGTELIDFSLDGNNISITYNGKSYESLSGGERQKLDIIIQFSLRDMLCAYTGFHTNIIVLDEIFDNLDELGSNMVIELISKHLSDIDGIFIISHHAKELNLPYDREMTIVKNENGVSYLL